jgi:glycosyltransferase involved in cell wall biosynthesis
MNSEKANSLCVLIPAFNEADSIVQVVCDLKALGLDLTIVVVDDGSTDETRELALEMGLTCLSHPINCGVGAALITGLTWASMSRFEQIVIVDADGQHPSESIKSMLEKLQGSDLAIGCRDWGKYDSIKLRKFAHALLRSSLKFKFGIQVSDVTSGFRAMNIKAARALIPTLGDQYLEDTIMLLVEAKKAKLRISEVPVVIRSRQAGKPSHGVTKSGVRYLSVLTKVLLATKGDKNK